MPLAEVIDLCQSSDGEEESRISQLPKTTRNLTSNQLTNVLILSDDYDQDFVESAPKRRRLTPPLTLKTAERPVTSDYGGVLAQRHVSAENRPQLPSNCALDGSDPIVFTSPQQPLLLQPRHSKTQNVLLSSISDADFGSSPPVVAPTASQSFSARTEALLAELCENKKTAKSVCAKRSENIPERPQPRPKSFKNSGSEVRTVNPENGAGENGKSQRAREREEEKERKRKQKEEERRQKAQEKQRAVDLAEVNRARYDKDKSTPDMILDIPTSLCGTSVETQVQELLKNLSVATTMYETEIPNMIKWRRKIRARFDEEAGHWEPIAEYIDDENHVLCFITAQSFVDLVSKSDDDERSDGLTAYMSRVRQRYRDQELIYLIEGLDAFMRKSKNARNRQYVAAVRAHAETDQAPSGSQAGRAKKKQDAIVDDEMIEEALLALQVEYGCLIHHTTSSIDSAQWICHFTRHISTIPWK